MNSCLVHIISLVLIINCVISVAKNDVEKSDNSTKVVTAADEKVIYFDGGSSVLPLIPSPKSRIKGRKGAVLDAFENFTDTSSPIASSTTNLTTVSNNNITKSTNLPPTQISSKTISPVSIMNSSVPTTTTARAVPKVVTTTTTTIATKKPHKKKPTITFSADDNPDILESEKNINFTSSKIEDPRMSQDTDRSVLNDDNKTRNTYIILMGATLAIPMVITVVHVAYKRIRNWMDLRHYQRVDFLIDGMYIS